MKTALAFLFALCALSAHAADIGLSLGRSQTELFNTARFAFPDLAQTDGRAGCCDNEVWEDKHALALKFDVTQRWGDIGLKASAEYLGAYDVAFDVSGNFSNPEPGRCVEHGTFKFFAATLQGTYTFHLGEIAIEPSVGLSANEALYHTVSRCDFQTFSDNVDRSDHRFSWSPIMGIGLAWRDWTAGADVRRIRLSGNAESEAYGMGQMNVTAVWIGHRF